MARPYQRVEASADAIWDALTAVYPMGYKWPDLVNVTGLSYGQARYGWRYLRDHLQVFHGRPAIVERIGNVYCIAEHQVDAASYIHWRLRDLATRCHTTRQTVIATDMYWPGTANVSLVMRQLKRVEEDVEHLLSVI